MNRRSAASFTLTVFALFSVSCMTWREQDLRTTPRPPAQSAKILSVIKNSGELIRFSSAEPGRVRGPAIVGAVTTPGTSTLELTGPFPLVKKRPDGSVYEVTDAKGQVHPVLRALKTEGDQMIVEVRTTAAVPVSIPLSEVRFIEVRKANGLVIALGVAGGVVLGSWLLASILASRD